MDKMDGCCNSAYGFLFSQQNNVSIDWRWREINNKNEAIKSMEKLGTVGMELTIRACFFLFFFFFFFLLLNYDERLKIHNLNGNGTFIMLFMSSYKNCLPSIFFFRCQLAKCQTMILNAVCLKQQLVYNKIFASNWKPKEKETKKKMKKKLFISWRLCF